MHQMRKRLSRIGMLFLATILTGTVVEFTTFTAFASQARTEESVLEDGIEDEIEGKTITQTIVCESDLPDNEELFAGYVEQQFYGNGGISLYGLSARRGLNEQGKNLYDFLKKEIERVAAGNTASTVFTANSATLESWNADTITGSFLEQFETEKVLDALLHDCPYDLYWFDKTAGLNTKTNRLNGQVNCISIQFQVAKSYQADNYSADSPAVNTTKTGATTKAVANANAVIAENANSQSDYDKLIAYRDYICKAVSYNNNAASSSYTEGYGDPWQLIYVFDNDTSTNVVCEGYSKAFQYLCDMTTFTDDIFCYTISGTMTSSNTGGGHMWNVVTMENGKNYLVDVTNSDTGTIGFQGGLFLAGTTNGSVSNGYTFALSQSIVFAYKSDMLELWGSDDTSILNLAGSNYVQTEKINISEENVTLGETAYTYDGTEKQPEITVLDLIEGKDYRVAYSNNVNVGTGTVTITGRNMYTGTIIKEFTINPKIITNPTIELSEDSYEYDGNEKRPAVVLKDGDFVIDSGEYTISYDNNVNAGTATVTIKDNEGGNYMVNGSATFTIVGKTLTEKDVTIAIDNTTYNGNLQRKEVTVRYGTNTLKETVDYSVSYPEDCINAGSKDITIKFQGNYIGSVSTSYKIEKAVISDITTTLNSIIDPEAGKEVKRSVASETGYQACLSWNCDETVFGFHTEYTATVTLTPNRNYRFADQINADGFDVRVNDDGTLNLIKTFEATRKAKVINVSAPENIKLTHYYEDSASVVGELPKGIHVTTEKGNVTMEPVWSCELYDNALQAQNTFTWSIHPDSYEDYDFTDITYHGQIVVSNTDGIDVNHIGTDLSTIYSYKGVYDVSNLFHIDENAGAASYEVIAGGTGEGNLEGSNLTVTKEGTFVIRLTTDVNGGYKAGTAIATLTLNKVKNPSNMPNETMPVPYSSKIIGDITLPAGWEWKEEDKTTVLEVGESVTATAVYNGADKGNYVIEHVEITITRQACTHTDETEVKGKKEATCGEDGYTGDTYCKVCGEEIAIGETISKTEDHKWDAGVVTKEATTTEKGEKTYTCSVCKTTEIEELPVKSISETPGTKPETPGATPETPGTTPDVEETEKQALSVGTEETDDSGKATYKVTTQDLENGTVTYVAPTNKKATTVTIPDTVTIDDVSYDVTAIGKNAFKNAKITKVTMGDNIETIGDNAFYGCKKIKTVKIGKNVKTIGNKAFYKCTVLTKVSLPSKVKTIGTSAFYGCEKLTSVTIGKSVTKIGSKSFYGCSKLKTLTIRSTKLTTKNVGSKAFGKTPKSMTAKVPKKKYKAYRSMLINRGVNKKAKFKKI